MVKDHLDNTFETIKAMCQHHNIQVETFRYRRKRGYTIEQCLSEYLIVPHKRKVRVNR